MSRTKDKAKGKIEIPTPEQVAEVTGQEAGNRQPADGEKPPASGQAEDVATPQDAAASELEEVRRERDEWRDKALRALADYQNFRRRAESEREQAARFAHSDFARSLLVVLDDIGRALDASRQNASRETLLRSMEIIHDHFRKALSDHGVAVIEAQDQPFDPALHEALQQQPSAEHEPGTVIMVIEPGYKVRDRVLRPARVVVSGAPPEPDPGASPARGDEETTDNANV